jgi:hypothetical protein
MFIPAPFNQFTVGNDRILQLAQRAGIQTFTACQTDGGCHPKLGLALRVSHMDVHGFAGIAFVGVEEKPKVFLSEYDGHNGFTSTCYGLRS